MVHGVGVAKSRTQLSTFTFPLLGQMIFYDLVPTSKSGGLRGTVFITLLHFVNPDALMSTMGGQLEGGRRQRGIWFIEMGNVYPS